MDANSSNDNRSDSDATAPSISQSQFDQCVDRCVASLMAKPEKVLPEPEPEQARLHAWLADDRHALDDGRPIDFALFDSAILSVEDRVPVAGSLARTQLLNAARRLTETLYAGVGAATAET